MVIGERVCRGRGKGDIPDCPICNRFETTHVPILARIIAFYRPRAKLCGAFTFSGGWGCESSKTLFSYAERARVPDSVRLAVVPAR